MNRLLAKSHWFPLVHSWACAEGLRCLLKFFLTSHRQQLPGCPGNHQKVPDKEEHAVSPHLLQPPPGIYWGLDPEPGTPSQLTTLQEAPYHPNASLGDRFWAPEMLRETQPVTRQCTVERRLQPLSSPSPCPGSAPLPLCSSPRV